MVVAYINILILSTFAYKVAININMFKALNDLSIIYYFDSCLIILINDDRSTINSNELRSADFDKEFR
jgi:5-bromo-4-chloroindolyl phosphate hydrolysis protein